MDGYMNMILKLVLQLGRCYAAELGVVFNVTITPSTLATCKREVH